MQEIIPPFTNMMSWLTLGLVSVAVVLVGLEALRFQQDRRRVVLGLSAMVLVLVATVASLLGLAARYAHHGSFLSPFVLPLVAAVLLFVLYRVSFPQLPAVPAARRERPTHLLLLVLGAGVVLGTGGLVLLDFLFS